MTLEHFNLPRQDWYDVISTDEKTGEIRGRIYKDRLIENFNAIENKLNEIIKLQPYNTKYPDTSKFIYSDVTLDSDTNKVVNLKSFIDIMGLKNTPLAVQFGDKKLARLSYYDNDYKLKNISNINLSDISSTKPFVIADIENQTITVSGDLTEISGKVILGKYNGESIDACLDTPVVNLDAYIMQIISSKVYTTSIATGLTDVNVIYYSSTRNNVMGLRNRSDISGTISDYTGAYNKEVE